MTRLTKRVLLIGWDAADWKIIHPLIEQGKMPFLKKLIEIGVSGKMATLVPIISPILWNSIATGKQADKHDILGFVEPSPDGKGARPVSSTSRKAKAIWNILSQSGLRSGVVNWYASHPAEPIDGTIFTNRFAPKVGPKAEVLPLDLHSFHPPEMLEFVESFQVDPRTISAEQMLPFFPNQRPTDMTDLRVHMLAKILAECATTHNVATHLVAQDDWDFLAVYYDAIDHVCHGFIEYYPPAMAHVSAEDAAIYGGVVTGMYRFHDMMLARLLDLAGPDTTVILISDHGFYSDHLRPNVAEHSRNPSDKFGAKMNPVAWHRPQGIFVAGGKSLKHDELIHGANLLDIAPTVLALLGLPIPEDMDGRVLTKIFTEPPEIERIPSYEPPHPKDGMHRDVSIEESDPFAARRALEQLAELGYIEMPDANDPAKAAKESIWDRQSNLAQVYFASSRPKAALEILEKMLAERDQPHLRVRVALCLLALGRAAEAEPIVAKVIADYPDQNSTRLIMGRILMAQDRLDEAFAVLEPLQKEDSAIPIFQSALGLVYLRRGVLDQAEAAFRRAIERDDDSVEAHDGLGIVLRRSGRYEDAVYEHMRAAALQHLRPQTHLNLGIALANSQQFDWAIRAFSLAAEMQPDLPLPHRWLAMIYRRVKKDRTKAREHIRIFVKLRRAVVERATKKTVVATESPASGSPA
jgi:predicted AlkP superfamily phosphohydrolase/phosphomutase/tetratricopeptide (TPR) repeat protein